MRFIKIILSVFFGFSATAQTILIKNTSKLDRNQEVVEIPWVDILKLNALIDTSNIKIVDVVNKKEVIFQYEKKGTPNIQNLLVLVSIPAEKTKTLKILKGKHMHFEALTFGRYVPERKDDFAWENNRIAFRMYGKALEKTPTEMAYGVDVWTKRTPNLIINKWYKIGNYHQDQGEGMDYYHVGLSLGAGGIAPIVKNQLIFPKNYTQWQIFDNGPLRTTFKLIYDPWLVNNHLVSMEKTIRIDAYSQMNKNQVSINYIDEKPIPVAIGIIKRKENGQIILDETAGIMAYTEPKSTKNGMAMIATITNPPITEMAVKNDHLLTMTNAVKGQNLIYYNGAAWDRAGQIKNQKEWYDYLLNYKNKLDQPLKIEVK